MKNLQISVKVTSSYTPDIKNRLFNFEGDDEDAEENSLEEAWKLIADIHWFENNHKKGYRAIKR
jgi:hypothetical protein